jgi:hypothetical protein
VKQEDEVSMYPADRDSVASNGQTEAVCPVKGRERPILFSAPMVRALLDGRKTQTRRIVKGTAAEWLADPIGFLPEFVADPGNHLCPYGVPGDLLWVREAFAYLSDCRHNDPGTRALAEGCFYRADDGATQSDISRWRPSIHMPRFLSRLTLRITDVRVERLQDISEADAVAEGLYKSFPDDADREWFKHHREDEGHVPAAAEWADLEQGVWMVPGVPQGWGLTAAERQRDQWAPSPQFAYRQLWNHINDPGSWDANPWLWCVAFERVPS